MVQSLTRRQIRWIDSCAIERLQIPGVILMENAGGNAARAFYSFLGEKGSVAVVAGSGNNGGDGFVIARHLANRGMKVVTFLAAGEEKISGDAGINLDAIRALGHDIREGIGDLGEFDAVVDAVGGTGISGELRGAMAVAVEKINSSGATVLAVDIPTGLDCDTGEAHGPVVRAAMTVTFVARKAGFDAPGALEYTGEVVVADIGIDPEKIISDFGFPGDG